MAKPKSYLSRVKYLQRIALATALHEGGEEALSHVPITVISMEHRHHDGAGVRYVPIVAKAHPTL